MKTFIEIILYIWQLPQNLLGLILLLCYKREKVYYRLNGRIFYFTNEIPAGISLGKYIIMRREDKEEGMMHEYGHTVSSRRLGPLYLLVIGLPSILGNIYDRNFHKKWKRSDSCEWYYNQPWEKIADKHGKVDRKAYIQRLRDWGR